MTVGRGGRHNRKSCMPRAQHFSSECAYFGSRTSENVCPVCILKSGGRVLCVPHVLLQRSFAVARAAHSSFHRLMRTNMKQTSSKVHYSSVLCSSVHQPLLQWVSVTSSFCTHEAPGQHRAPAAESTAASTTRPLRPNWLSSCPVKPSMVIKLDATDASSCRLQHPVGVSNTTRHCTTRPAQPGRRLRSLDHALVRLGHVRDGWRHHLCDACISESSASHLAAADVVPADHLLPPRIPDLSKWVETKWFAHFDGAHDLFRARTVGQGLVPPRPSSCRPDGAPPQFNRICAVPHVSPTR